MGFIICNWLQTTDCKKKKSTQLLQAEAHKGTMAQGIDEMMELVRGCWMRLSKTQTWSLERNGRIQVMK